MLHTFTLHELLSLPVQLSFPLLLSPSLAIPLGAAFLVAALPVAVFLVAAGCLQGLVLLVSFLFFLGAVHCGLLSADAGAGGVGGQPCVVSSGLDGVELFHSFLALDAGGLSAVLEAMVKNV